jgi:hypothetical protein
MLWTWTSHPPSSEEKAGDVGVAVGSGADDARGEADAGAAPRRPRRPDGEAVALGDGAGDAATGVGVGTC